MRWLMEDGLLHARHPESSSVIKILEQLVEVEEGLEARGRVERRGAEALELPHRYREGALVHDAPSTIVVEMLAKSGSFSAVSASIFSSKSAFFV